MGYTSVADRSGAVAAAARLSRRSLPAGAEVDPTTTVATMLPQLVEQVAAEAGVWDENACARALVQSAGDISRAVSLVRAWAATMQRIGRMRAAVGDLRVLRRITPGYAQPPAGQYLGASLDYAQRLLDFESGVPGDAEAEASIWEPAGANGAAPAVAGPPRTFPRALEAIEAEGLVAPANPAAEPVDITRESPAAATTRGGLLQLLSRAETGAITALAYCAIRGYGQRQDPTLVELRGGMLPVHVHHPVLGVPVEIGEIPMTACEIVHYRAHDGQADRRLTLGAGVTLGRVERRAIAAAMLDAGCARGSAGSSEELTVTEDPEFLATALDGQEATGFVEHLKLPHHVTFQSDLDVVRAARRLGGGREEPGA